MITLSAKQARRLLLSLQGLAEPPRRRLGADGLLRLIDDLGFLQLDSIQTVARAHHMILFARAQAYRPADLRRLHEGRELFEHWSDRIAALIPMRFYPHWNERFRRERPKLERSFSRWYGDGYKAELDRILAQIQEGGPLMARDLAGERRRAAGGWWDWHAGKAALEFLWRAGDLAVSRREGFQKVYDLAERVIPDAVRALRPPTQAVIDWACRSALDRLGLATPGELARFFGLVTVDEAKAWCREQEESGLVEALVEGIDGRVRPLVARPDIARLITNLPDPPRRMRVLSPFDPILRDRARLERWFGFDYRIEVFVPAARRRYGYYVFPLLEGERLIGRIDLKADRDASALSVTALWLEPRQRLSTTRRGRLDAELDRIRRFIGLDRLRFADDHLRQGG